MCLEIKGNSFLASWINELSILDVKLPALARNISACLSRRALPLGSSLSEVQLAYRTIVTKVVI